MKILKKADQLLLERETDFPENLFQAQDLLLEVADQSPAEAYPRLSEVMFWLGEYVADAEDQEEFYGEGVEFGRQAVKAAPESCAAHLWFAANMGAHGVVRGVMSSLSYLGDLEKHGKQALQLDELYFYAAPLRLMGRFYHKVPGFPIGPGNTGKAIALLERAVELGPEFILNHLYLADAYLSKRKKMEAKSVLERALETSAPPTLSDYHAIVQVQAQDMLSKC